MQVTRHHTNPLTLFTAWLDEARVHGLPEYNAMSLATTRCDGWPSARTVLLKQCDEAGFYFYTNYESQKARELAQNPRAALLFYWPQLGKQIRVEGLVQQTDRSKSEEYFATRDRLSQIGAWASQQSSPLAHPDTFAKAILDHKKMFDGRDVPCPPHWGGYCLTPCSYEFWQAKAGRLHERMVYRKKDGQWDFSHLYP